MYETKAQSCSRHRGRSFFVRRPRRFQLADFLDQRPEERLDVGHQADGLERAAVVEFDDRRWVDVDANDFDPRRQQIADRHRMQRRGDHQAKRDAANFLSHLPLSFQRVGDNFRQRAVVADAAGQQEIDVVLNALIHDAAA